MKRLNRQEQMFAFMELQQHSGQTIAAFCQEHGVTISNFNYWLRKYRRSKESPSGFIAITPPIASAPIRLLYPNGVAIELSDPDLSLISALLRIA